MKRKHFYTSAAWKIFREYILLLHGNYSSGTWFVMCSTSGQFLEFPKKNVHVGHYIKVYDGNSSNFATAFEEKNVMPQRGDHNTYQGGKQDVMAGSIEKYWGKGTIDFLNIKRHNICKMGKFELDIIKEIYEKKYLKLANTKGDPFSNVSRLDKKYRNRDL